MIGISIEAAISPDETMTNIRRFCSLSESFPATSTAMIMNGTPTRASNPAVCVATAELKAGRM